MAYREIPEGSVEVQVGLWAKEFTVSAGSITRTGHKLYSSEGYCFYCTAENLDEDGNLLPENERTYAQFRSTTCVTVDDVNARFVSVPVQADYYILGDSNHVTA